MGAALTLATALLCLACTSLRESAGLKLSELERSQATLMSCARDTGPLSSSELLWCADASSPLCLPALPASGHIELSDAPPCALRSPLAPTTLVFSWIERGWHRPLPLDTPSARHGGRLERPPRA
jgi:hypothetical protein